MSASTTVPGDGMKAVLDVARRLAEEFDEVPLAMVSHAVKAAAEAARLFGEDVRASLPTIERLAREDLLAVATARAEGVAAPA